MSSEGIQPVMNVGGSGNGWGDGLGSFGGIIGLLAVLGIIGNGGLFNGGNNRDNGNDALAAAIAMSGSRGYQPQYATQDFVQASNNFNSLVDQNRALSNQITSGTAQSVAATNQAFHDQLSATQNLYNELQRDIAANAVTLANIQGHQSECCCNVLQKIGETSAATDAQIAAAKYESAMQIAGVEQRITSKMDQNKIEALQAQVYQLQLAQATNGVLRFPNSWSYGAGPFPPIFGGCCGNGNNI